MERNERTSQPVETERPHDLPGTPDTEGISGSDVAERLDQDPDEQLNRPDQAGADPEERRQYDEPRSVPADSPHEP